MTSHTKNKHFFTQKDINDYYNKTISISKGRKFKGVTRNPDGTLSKSGKTIIPKEKIPDFLKKLYNDPKTGYIGRDKLLDKVNKLAIGVSSRDITSFLQSYEPHQMHRQHHKKTASLPILIKSPMAYLQIDLVLAYKDFSGHNKGRKILLTAIDMNTRFAFVRFLRNKKASVVLEGMKSILDQIKTDYGRYPSIIQSDQGSEFMNELNKYLNKRGIKHVYSKSHTPQSQGVIERFNGTIKQRIARYMSANNTKTIIDVLPDLVFAYNNSYHSTIQRSPNDMVQSEKHNTKGFQYLIKKGIKRYTENNRLFPKINHGDYVRLSMLYYPEERRLKNMGQRKDGSSINWSSDIYTVLHVHDNGRITKNREIHRNNTYTIQSTNDKSDIKKNIKREWLLKTVHPEKITRLSEAKKVLDNIDKRIEIEKKIDQNKGKSDIAARIKRNRRRIANIFNH